MASECVPSLSVQPLVCNHSTSPASIDEKRLAAIVDEIKAVGGDAIGVAGDVGADDFPKKIVDATVQCVIFLSTAPRHFSSNLEPTQKIR